MVYSEVIEFWFKEIKSAQWWKKDDEFDQHIVDRFSVVHARAVQCELFEWRESSEGRLAEIIVLDQFSRNMFRGTPNAFANDALALMLAQQAVALKVDEGLNAVQISFLYLPYMHSESLAIHDIALNLYRQKASKDNLRFEIRHRDIIERFGRYPHRNDILGRTSTAEEIAFLTQPGSGF